MMKKNSHIYSKRSCLADLDDHPCSRCMRQTHIYTLTHSHTCTQTDTHTHTHTHSLSLSLSLPLSMRYNIVIISSTARLEAHVKCVTCVGYLLQVEAFIRCVPISTVIK